jgi:hypothetical protein
MFGNLTDLANRCKFRHQLIPISFLVELCRRARVPLNYLTLIVTEQVLSMVVFTAMSR